MEFIAKEVEAVAKAETDEQQQWVQLSDLQLAVVGGGAGDVVFH